MRRSLFVSTALAALLVAAPVRAEDEPPAPAAAEPTPLRPAVELKPIRLPFALEHLAPPGSDRPKGWRPATTTQPESAPTTAALLRLARAAGVDGDKVAARCIPVAKGESESTVQGTLGYLVVGVEAKTLTPKLAEAAAAHGWRTKNIAVPSAVLITWAADDEDEAALQAWQTETAVHNLCAKGWDDMTTARQEFDQNVARTKFARGQACIAAARDTLPEAAYVNAILAQIFGRQADRALEHARKALKSDAPVPAPDAMVVTAAFTVGGALLTTGTEADVAEALAALKRGVAAEAAAETPFHRFGNRYNLACCYARQDKLDPAFEHLEESLRYLKDAWVADKAKSSEGTSRLNYPSHYEHAKTRDTDMEPLRADPRFAKLMEAYHPDAKAPGAEKKDEK